MVSSMSEAVDKVTAVRLVREISGAGLRRPLRSWMESNQGLRIRFRSTSLFVLHGMSYCPVYGARSEHTVWIPTLSICSLTEKSNSGMADQHRRAPCPCSSITKGGMV